MLLILSVDVEANNASKASKYFIEFESLFCEKEKKNELTPKMLVTVRDVNTNLPTNLCLFEELFIVERIALLDLHECSACN
tara:strand:+ start:439 stop:681 length:243 start_codon:yes stop_codon:yes gene_type:complete